VRADQGGGGVSWCERDGKACKQAGSTAGARGSMWASFLPHFSFWFFFRGYHDLPVTGRGNETGEALCASAV
jgi:hypothetical protein